MDEIRKEGIGRLKDFKLETSNPYFLHYRSLFSDLEKASANARGRLLDIGCGNKPYERMFAGRVTEHVGCDVVQSSENRVDYLCPATKLPFDPGSFDTVIATQVIEHVADHQAMLAESFRVLRNDGVLILSGPMYWPLHEEPYDFFRFTKHGLKFLLEKIGFTKIEIVNNGGKWALCGQVLIHSLAGTKLGRRSVTRTINKLFAYLDDRNMDSVNPMNYVVVARKLPGVSSPASVP